MGQKMVCFAGLAGRDLVKTSRKRCMKQGELGRLWGARGGISFSGSPVLSVVVPCTRAGPGVRGESGGCATALFATEAQGKAYQDESREILYENKRLHMASEGKQHLGHVQWVGILGVPLRRMKGRFPKAAFSGI
jgi:hypothetical protein